MKTYQPFQNYLQQKLEDVNKIYKELSSIPLASFSPKKIPYIGYTMQKYYKLYKDEEMEHVLLFSFGFHGYLDNISGVSSHINNKNINKAYFSRRKKALLNMKQSYYPIMQNQKDGDKNYTQ